MGTTYEISIHLMFLLIQAEHLRISSTHYFNTSHVSINPGRWSVYAQTGYISIHLMFLLILDLLLLINALHNHFNTSHVSINRYPDGVYGGIQAGVTKKFYDYHFNTSHVSINRDVDRNIIAVVVFQYISCFY